MSVRINATSMTLEIDNRVVAAARFSPYAAGDDLGAWIVSTHPRRLFSRDEAIALIERRHPDGLTAPTPMAIAHHLLKRWAYKPVTFGE